MTDLTSSVRRILIHHFSDDALNRWFDPLRLKENGARECEIIWPHSLFASWIRPEEKYALEQAIREAKREIRLIYHSTPEHGKHTGINPNSGQFYHERNPILEPVFPFGSEYTLDNFFINTKNNFPLNVLKETAGGMLRYNPLVLYGDTSTGKSHLLRALGNALSSLYGNTMLFCGSADDFADFQAPLQDREVLWTLRSWQAVIIDDIQRIAAMPRVQEILPLVLDHCREVGKPFVCASNLPPGKWNEFAQRVSSRLEQGLVMILHEADMDIRLRYVQQHSRLNKLNLSRDQLLSLAQQCTSLRRLAGIMQRLSALKDILGHDVSQQDVDGILAHTADSTPVSPQDIIRTVAVHLGVRVEDITSDKRHPKVARARQLAMFLCRSLLGSSYPALGKMFGGRDHSTVIHSVKKIQQLWDTDTDTHNLLAELSVLCRQQFK